MRYFRLDTMGDLQDRGLAFVTDPPSDLPWPHLLRRGEAAGPECPEEIRLNLSSDHPGLRLGSLLGNSLRYLLIATALKGALTQLSGFDSANVELLPFVLYNHKQRIHSRDYWIINPLGTHDCVNRDASDIEYLEPDKQEIVGIETLVFDVRRLTNAPDLFRVPEDSTLYFISERLGRAWHSMKATNVLLHEIAVR